MQPAFEDIRIVDLDTRRTTGSRVHESMRVVYLRLDRVPPDREWIRLFHEERESRINPLRCGLWYAFSGCGAQGSGSTFGPYVV